MMLEKWIENLRSGRFEQTKGWLRSGEGYCCLGVACETFIEGGGTLIQEWDEDVTRYEGAHKASLPPQVREALGLRWARGNFNIDSQEVLDVVRKTCPAAYMGQATALTDLNDNGATFEDIARVIELRPEGLFCDKE